MYNLKKYTQKDRYGNTITFEVERMQEPTVPSMQDIPQPDHPGGPKGTDTVPAWLTPGEFVMNAEATRMYEPQIKAMNDHGRAIQKAQGGTIPEYHSDGGEVPYSRDAYMAELIPAAKAEAERLGVDPRIIVAQSIQETGWGKKAPENAYFGIKSHGYKGKNVDFGTHEYEDGQKVNMRDSFRGYDSLSDSVRGYGDFMLANPRYKPYMEAEGLDAQLAALGKSGYATDPNYAKNLKNIIGGRTFRKYYRADGSEEPEVPVIDILPMPVDGIVEDMAGFEETNPNPPTVQDITMQYGTPEMTYNERRDLRDQMAMDTATSSLNNYKEVPETENEILNPYAQQEYEKKEFAIPKPMGIPEGGDEFSGLDSPQELTEEDKRRVEEGRKRRAEEHRKMLAEKPASEITQADRDRQEQLDNVVSGKIKQEYINIDPDAKGEDMNTTYDMEAIKTFADKYGEPDDAEFDKMDKEFANLPSSKDESSFLDNFISKDMQASIGGFFSKMMNHALSDRALSALVMNYVGSRAMGYDHGASFQFAAKKYGKQIEAGQALEDKLYLSGKYKAPSIKRAMEKGDFGELELAKSGLKQVSNFKNFYRGGKTYRAQEFKDGDGNSYWYTYDPVSKQTVPIDISFTEDDRYAPGSKGYAERMDKANKKIQKIYEDEESLYGIRSEKKDGVPTKYFVQRRPSALTADFMAWAKKNGFDPDDSRAQSIIGQAYRQAIKDVSDGKLKEISDITPYLDAQMIRESTNSNELFMINRDKYEAGEQAPKYVRGDLMKGLYDKASATARAKGFKDEKSGRQAVFAHAVAKWGELAETDPKAYAKYMKSGSKDVGTSPFYNFMNDEFDKIMKSMAEKQ